MGFLQDWVFYNSGNMAPREFHLWAALSGLAMVAGRKVYVIHGSSKENSYFEIYPDLFVCLVGRAGLKKSLPKDKIKELLLSCIPDYPIGPSVQSREDIVKTMSTDRCLRDFEDENGVTVFWKPYAFFVNELKNFMSINPSGMIEFLTDIYDRKFFDAGTIKHGLQEIINPCINILACETPKWIINNLKRDVISGGFSRRMLFMYVTRSPEKIPFPFATSEMLEAYKRCQDHITKINTLVGPFQWEPEARLFISEWYTKLITPNDEILEAFYENKDILATKIAMLIAIAEYPPRLVITRDVIKQSVAILEELEINLPKLSAAAGRNDLAVPTQRILDLLERSGGWMPLKMLRREMGKDLDPREEFSVFRYLQETDQVVKQTFPINGTNIEMVLTVEKYNDLMKETKK